MLINYAPGQRWPDSTAAQQVDDQSVAQSLVQALEDDTAIPENCCRGIRRTPASQTESYFNCDWVSFTAQ
jgi:hypothetical protein